MPPPLEDGAKIAVEGLAFGYGSEPIQNNLSFTVATGSIFAIMGGSGCGKSTLLKVLIGLLRPLAGTVHVRGEDYWSVSADRREQIGRRCGVLFQSGALWSSMSIADNVALPLRMFTALTEPEIDRLVQLKLDLVGLTAPGDMMPSDLSGGMRKRVGLARAMALDPDILFLDEPSAGLDPIGARRLDDLILALRDGFGSTVVMVSHELPSLFAICDGGIFLDADTHTAIAIGAPRDLRDRCDDPTVHAFMNREIPKSDSAVDDGGQK
ncbi:ABC transporter ATP-binding protein [Magnetospirillum molischianum]|uniref:Putative ABC transporter (ATP-binding protein) n=1 Tax=Magnetospirillum molischianum DSM 120 TaxID=1150626 RepID=H8FX77_MAGML|nr:ATP-binding cassette domain-containing protein [Magnetospirillum molischianum]CCG42965.1 Putative ABC transporter (ATP-binding protein) [Magnetospirillum molischianum DSM 120]